MLTIGIGNSIVSGKVFETSPPEPEVAHWVGFSNTDGVPNAPIGAWGDYTNTLDRQYGREWVAYPH